jgi:hypothetical protein
MIYNITFYSEMGHLLHYDSTTNSSSSIPEDINKFIWTKIELYVDIFTTKEGCQFYCLKPGFKEKFTYYYYNDIVNITYDLDNVKSVQQKMNPDYAPPTTLSLFNWFIYKKD